MYAQFTATKMELIKTCLWKQNSSDGRCVPDCSDLQTGPRGHQILYVYVMPIGKRKGSSHTVPVCSCLDQCARLNVAVGCARTLVTDGLSFLQNSKNKNRVKQDAFKSSRKWSLLPVFNEEEKRNVELSSFFHGETNTQNAIKKNKGGEAALQTNSRG